LAGEQDKLLGGLLSLDFDERSCRARYKSSSYRKASSFHVSPYLVQRLREYEKYHRKCGPHSEFYKEAIEQLKSGKNVETECKYTVFTQGNGLGNRMLALVSTFLYSLLTKRILLVEMIEESKNVFCEPFPESSWELGSDFPIKDLTWKFQKESPESFINLLENGTISLDSNVSVKSLPPYVFFDAWSIAWHVHSRIFCEDHQKVVQKFTWMITKSDCYYAPALFLYPEFENELKLMFPVKESMFHHLGRYLFQPANPVWEMIERFYQIYLINTDEKIGLQIRIIPFDPPPFEKVYGRIIECSEKEKLLPEIGTSNLTNSASSPTKRTSILVISLFSEYYEKIKSTYYENSTITGELVSVLQPTHEEAQNTLAQFHNQKALAEMYLLSYCDKIAITAMSTFGYIAHGLAGLNPFILRTLFWQIPKPGPACVRSMSVEPCLHSPPFPECKPNTRVNPAEAVPYLRFCEDFDNGVKLFD
jgi:xyloglucan fucosyltransferase